VPHDRRGRVTPHDVAHVTVRLRPVVTSLRNGRAFRVIRACIASGRERFGFRLIEFSVQGQHLHLVCEADDARALARGMQGLSVRLARRLNRHLGRSGTLLADRYHSRVLRTPTEVRNVLAYVLGNARKHAAERGERLERGWIDPWSSGPHFSGWRNVVRPPSFFARGPRATAPPRSWLLRIGWKRRGLLSVDAIPGS
jgi:REP element-mobilizing transposase RayT